MKRITQFGLIALLLAMNPLHALAQTIFFSDVFTNGSTLDSLTPAKPTTNSANYVAVSNKNRSPNPSITSQDLRFGIASSSGGIMEIQALFATNAVALTQPGDYIQMVVTFTNFSGLLTSGSGFFECGLYNSGQVQPYPGGMNGNLTTGSNYVGAGYVQNWQGYVGIVGYSGQKSQIATRPQQTGADSTDNRSQDLVTDGGSGGSSYLSGATVGSTITSALTLSAPATYTEVLNLTMIGPGSLMITNTLYPGPNTNGTPLTQFGGIATNSTYLTAGFDGLAVGWYQKTAGSSNTTDIASIVVSGSVTTISGPPNITSQPVPVTVAANGACPFSVTAIGFDVTYQWHRNGTNLLNGGNISGATSSTLVVSQAGPADALSGANGYYVTVTGAGPFSTNSITNSLSLIPATNLIFTAAAGATWDLNNTFSWEDTNSNPQVFNYGDSVTFDDNASSFYVTLTGSFLSASSVLVNSTNNNKYTFAGTGSFAGPGNLIYTGNGALALNTANTYSGGTLISNTLTPASLSLSLGNYAGLGTGPVVLDNAGGTLETTVTGGSATGIAGTINLLDDFTIQVDGTGTYATVFLGDLFGTSGKTLTINPKNSGTTDRFRAYGTNTVFNANLVLDTQNASTSQALYGGSSLAPYASGGSQSYNGIISGYGGIVQRGSATTYLNNNQNTYSGGTFPTGGTIGLGADTIVDASSNVLSGPIGINSLFLAPENGSATSSGTVLASGGPRTIANPLQYCSGTNNLTLIFGGTNNLTFTAPFDLSGIDGQTSNAYPSRIFQVANTAATTLAGSITDSTSFYALTKTGAGTLYLNATNTYAGVTTNSAGLLAGAGSVAGSVIVTTNASIGGGDTSGIGTFTVGGNLILTNGNGFFRVNRAGLLSDQVYVAGGLTNNGTGVITVTNLGATLLVGDRFAVFNKAMSNGAAMSVTGGYVTWSNNLALNGSIVVVQSPDSGLQVAAPASVPLGGSITNTLSVTNLGPGTAAGLVVTDILSANVTFVSASGGGTTNANAGQVVWSGFSLAANTGTNFTLIVLATAGGNATNLASVASSVIDPNPANNTATSVTLITTVIIPTVPPHIGSFKMVGLNVVISGTNGVNGGTYYLMDSTNLAKPLSQWTAVATNVVNTNGASGGFTFTGTNAITTGLPQQFYILSNTNH